jgi:pimeloyl-ACP methyl ester carboxylesterase
MKNRRNIRRPFSGLIVLLAIIMQFRSASAQQLSESKLPTPLYGDRCRSAEGRLRRSRSANGQPVILLHSWPCDINSYVNVSGMLAAKGYHMIVHT